MISTAARWTLRASSLFAVLYVAEVIAIVYFAEVLTYGAVTFITPAYTLIVLFATAAYLFQRWQSPRPEMPPPRLNGRPLDRGTQAALFAALDEAARSAAGASAEGAVATLEPPVALISGPVECGELVHGYLLLLPLPLCAVLTIEEFRALAAQQYAPLRWHGGPYAKQIDRVHCEARARMARMAPPDSAFSRLAFLLPGTGFCALALRPAEGFEQLVAGATIETDRIAAARFGSVDLARGLMKTYAAFVLWPRFRYEMAAELKRWEQTPQPHPYELIGRRFAEFLTPERVAPVLAQALPELRERLARIGQPLMMDLDLAPAEPALGLVREAEAIDRALSAAERARMVFERPAAAAQRLEVSND